MCVRNFEQVFGKTGNCTTLASKYERTEDMQAYLVEIKIIQVSPTCKSFR